MNILITGTSKGIGRETTLYFLSKGHEVYGIDILESSIQDSNYHHYIADISKNETLPELPTMNIVVNNAGVQNSYNDIEINLCGTIYVTEKYGVQKDIISILNVASASAHTGAEFPFYSASKGGMLSYTKNVALRIAKYGATCNSISPGGVLTELNAPVTTDEVLWNQIMDLTPLKRWATADEIAEWIYFLTVRNKFMTAQDVLIDGGESSNSTFIWKEDK